MNNDFEKHIKDKLSNYQSSFDDGLWDKIQAQRKVDKRRILLPGWKKIAVFSGVILLIVLAYQYEGYNAKVQSKLEIESEVKNRIKNIESNINDSMQMKKNKDSLENIIENKNLENNNKDRKLNKDLVFHSSKLEKINSSILMDIPSSTTKILTPILSGREVKVDHHALPIKDQKAVETSTDVQRFDEMQLLSSTLPFFELSTDKDWSLLNIECANFNDNYPVNYYAEFWASPQFVFKQMKGDPSYLNLRDSTESFHFAFATGVRVSAIHHSGFALRTGIEYGQVNDIFSHSDDEVRHIFELEFGDTLSFEPLIVETDTLSHTIIEPEKKSYKNKLTIVEIPIQLGYEFETEKFKFFVNAGVGINIFTVQNGYILSPEITTEELNRVSGLQPKYEHNMGLNFYGSFGTAIELGFKTDLVLEPHFKYAFNPISYANYDAKERHLKGGVLMGIRYRF